MAFNHDGRTHFVGYFADEAAAARAYDARVSELAGPFAQLNFPNPSDCPTASAAFFWSRSL